MKETNNYEAIFKRKSIRKYDFAPLDDEILGAIREKLENLKPLYNDIKTEFIIAKDKDVKALLPIKAPYYIVAFSENREGYLTNVGFMLQQMDLFLSENGIGSCWQGMPKPTKKLLSSSKHEFVIVMAFGKPTEPLYREGISEFKRKKLEDITNVKGSAELVEAARLAPSGINSQPWYYSGDNGIINAYCAKPKLISGFIYEKMNKIDMGIGICHLWISAKKIGKETEFVKDKQAENNPPKGYYYITSMKMK